MLFRSGRARAKAQNGDVAGGIADLDHVVAVFPEATDAFADRGLFHRANGDAAGALAIHHQRDVVQLLCNAGPRCRPDVAQKLVDLQDDTTGVDVIYTGMVPLFYEAQNELLRGLFNSFMLAFLLIAVVLFLGRVTASRWSGPWWLWLAIWGAMRLGQALSGRPNAAALLLVGSPVAVLATHALTPDLPLLACTLAGMGGLLTARPGQRWIWALVVGIGAWFRYSDAALIPVVALWPWLRGARDRKSTRMNSSHSSVSRMTSSA